MGAGEDKDLIRAQYEAGSGIQEWFEAVYAGVDGQIQHVPWARERVNHYLKDWLGRYGKAYQGKKALVIGCGLGDDAEALAEYSLEVSAFDISSTAIEWCQRRFPQSTVAYQVGDLFKLPTEWLAAFDLVVEIYTIQSLPHSLRETSMQQVRQLIKPAGTLVLVAFVQEEHMQFQGPPWPLKLSELRSFTELGLALESEQFFKDDRPRVRQVYRAIS
ncbi:methyltransferase domain-containing protein [Anaerolineales bacterium]